MRPLVSVVVPAFNPGESILEALGSVLSQDCESLEVIVVDDGSSTPVAEVLGPLGEDRRVTCLRQPNAGAAAARNAGIRASRGAFVAFLDADDLLLPGSLARRAAVLLAGDEVDLVFTDFLIEETPGKRTRNERYRQLLPSLGAVVARTDGGTYYFSEGYLDAAIALRGIFPFTGAVMVRRSCLDRSGTFDTSLRIAEDLDLWIRLFDAHRVAYIDEPLSLYRKTRPGRLTLDRELYHRETIRMLEGRRLTMSGPRRALLGMWITDARITLGIHHLDRGEGRAAAGCLVKSLGLSRLRGLLFLPFAFLPSRAFKAVRKDSWILS